MAVSGRRRTVLILGAGFAGVRAALDLGRAYRRDSTVRLILISAESYHEYHACFYEIATAERLDAPAGDLRATSCVILEELFAGLPVEPVVARIREIEPRKKIVSTERGAFVYDALIVGLGSTTNYYGIPGLERQGLPLKSLRDALAIRGRVEQLIRGASPGQAEIVIGGGGFTGCELAGELINFGKRVSVKAHGHARAVRLTIIEAGQQLLPGMPLRLADIVRNRLTSLGVSICLGARLQRVNQRSLEVSLRGEVRTMPFDALIWTGGITGSPVVASAGWQTNDRGQVIVNAQLGVPGFPGVFVVGDSACVSNPVTRKPLPAVAPVAIAEGRLAAANVQRYLLGQLPLSYKPYHAGFIIPVSGKFAIAELRHVRLVGFLGWILRRLVDLRYFASILPFWRALALWWRGTVLYTKND